MFFEDGNQAEKILNTSEPVRQKALGRKVKGFSKLRWDTVKEGIVEKGNFYKFLSPDLRRRLLATGDAQLVEASPTDRIWGIGFNKKDAEANLENWGLNLLGNILMKLRQRYKATEHLWTRRN